MSRTLAASASAGVARAAACLVVSGCGPAGPRDFGVLERIGQVGDHAAAETLLKVEGRAGGVRVSPLGRARVFTQLANVIP